MSNNATEKDILWESHHEYVANTLFALGAEMAQFIADFYKKHHSRHYYKKVQSAIYNEWYITEGMLRLTFQWPDDNEHNNDIIVVLRNLHSTPYLDIIDDGWCPQLLQDTLLQSNLVQRFVHLDEEYGIFIQEHKHVP